MENLMKSSVLTLVGADQPGIVAAVTDALYQQGCSLAQASMMRLGANFAIMLRVSHNANQDLEQILSEICNTLGLHLHLDDDVVDNISKLDPNIQVTVYGADREGIVAQVTSALAMAGLNIVDLETDIGGNKEKPIYIMTLEGVANNGIEPLQKALQALDSDIEVNLDEINTLRG
jgi:glycine cleavage system transcriptional repressor